MSLYDIAAYGAMIADEARLQAYREALRCEVREGSIVLDLGTGTGIHALLACQMGAARVYAIEPADAIQVAREIAQDNGFGDRIVFVQDVSTQVSLPEPVDLIVSDVRGVTPFFGRGLPSIIDARKRLLRDNGALIPQRDQLWAAIVEAPEQYDEIVGPWESDSTGLDMRAARRMVTQAMHRKRVGTEQLLAAPQRWGAIDYATVEDASQRGAVEYSVERPCRCHGVAVWFDGTLAEGVQISNAPGAAALIYGTAFLPLPEPVDVDTGAHVEIEIGANLVGADYVWSWNTTITRADEPKIGFRQSSFHGSPLSALSLQRAAADYVPELTEQGLVDLEAIGMIDGKTPQRDIAAHLAERYPESFSSRDEALDRVAALARRYGK